MMNDNKQEILETRIGGLGSSDAPMVYRIGERGFLSEADKFRIAVMLGLEETKIFSTEATRLGTEIENRIFEALKQINPKYVSNPKYISKTLSERYGFSIFNHIDFELEGDKCIYWEENKAVLEEDIEKVKQKYIYQLAWHFMLLKEKAKMLKKEPYLSLLKYDTNEFDINEPLDPQKLIPLDINYKDVLPYICMIEEGLRIIKDAIPNFEYVKKDEFDASFLPQVQIDYMNEIAERLSIIQKNELEIEEFKTKMYDLMTANDIKSIKHDLIDLCAVAPTSFVKFDSKRFKKDNPKQFEKYKQVGFKAGFLKITLKDKKDERKK